MSNTQSIIMENTQTTQQTTQTEQPCFNLGDYCDIAKCISDNEYAKSLGLKVVKVNGLNLIKYIKSELNAENVKTLGLFRSVIVDNNANLLSYSLPKSYAFEEFVLGKPDEMTALDYLSNFEVSYMVDGTMINVFWNPNTNDWEIATRSNIGANCSYNTEYTFRYMFLDCMNKCDLTFDMLDKNVSYSFVFQHPDNRIVENIQRHQIYLIAMFKFDGHKVMYHKKNEYAEKQEEILVDLELLQEKTDEDFKTNLDNMIENMYTQNSIRKREEYIPGIMFINKKTGERTKIRNKGYEYIRRLKGNSNKDQFKYYSLRKLGQVKEYLKHFPEDSQKFHDMMKVVHEWTNKLFGYYIDCFINKTKHVKEYPYEFVPHICGLHDIYLKELRIKGQYINKYQVIQYVNNLEPERLMFAINYPIKQSKKKND